MVQSYSTDTTTRISNIDPSTPAGLCKAYRLGAAEILIDARGVRMPDLTGQYILVFHAAELSLKAFLAKKGMTAQDLKRRPFGHDLGELYKEAKKHGLALTSSDAEGYLDAMNQNHRDGTIRYEFAETRTLPMCDLLIPLVVEILEASK
jgi:hypothetical protein